ncbi:MAG: AraC family transcriptional regulator [Deltaproteobacteria bacterium]|nr:AraC family transcriptional regulator [Deltaproteobacteria bacterium]
MRKEPSTAEKRNGAVAPKLVDLTDRVRFREVWKRQDRSQRDHRLVNAAPVGEGSHEGPGAPDVATLARLIGAYAPHDGRFALPIPGVHAIRASRTNTKLVHTLWQPGLCIVAQGAKRVMLGQNVYEYDESRMLVAAVEVPVAARVTRASRAEPYLCLRLDFDPQRITELVWKVYPHGLPRVHEIRAMYVGQTNAQIVNAARRLVELMAQPEDAELLAPLVIDEILIRLLRSPGGARVAQLGLAESRVHKVAQALAWLRANFSEPMTVEALAKLVHMSTSAFHQHFKAVTSMSPLQFQKVLRLQEAQRLMLSMMMDVSTASLRVGYLSVSQFSREYSRFFGSSPTKDIARLREHLVSGGTQFPV